MAENNVAFVPCFICIGVSPPHFKYVVNHEAYARDHQVSTTPATAIPNGRLAEVREAMEAYIEFHREMATSKNGLRTRGRFREKWGVPDNTFIEAWLMTKATAALALLGDAP